MDSKKNYILSIKFSFLYIFFNVLCCSIWGIIINKINDFIYYVTPHQSCGVVCSIDMGQIILGLAINFFFVLIPFLYLIPKTCYYISSEIIFRKQNDGQEAIKATNFSILIITLIYILILFFVMPYINYLFYGSLNDLGTMITLIMVGNLAFPILLIYDKKKKK